LVFLKAQLLLAQPFISRKLCFFEAMGLFWGWNSGMLKYWFGIGSYLFLNFLAKIGVAIKPFFHYPKTHFPIIPAFQLGAWGQNP
jgi:hypothetical protein